MVSVTSTSMYLFVSKLFFVSDKTIKLWKVGKRRLQYKGRARAAQIRSQPVKLPELINPAPDVSAYQAFNKKVYANAHAYHINSLALNSDMETFISADDLRINWWHLNDSSTTFSKLTSLFIYLL